MSERGILQSVFPFNLYAPFNCNSTPTLPPPSLLRTCRCCPGARCYSCLEPLVMAALALPKNRHRVPFLVLGRVQLPPRLAAAGPSAPAASLPPAAAMAAARPSLSPLRPTGLLVYPASKPPATLPPPLSLSRCESPLLGGEEATVGRRVEGKEGRRTVITTSYRRIPAGKRGCARQGMCGSCVVGW